MGDRVRSDHPSVTTLRGKLVRRGGTRRPAIAVPTEDRDAIPSSGQMRLVLDGRERSAPVGPHLETRAILGAFDNARRARERAGVDRLAEWVTDRGLERGRSVLVDVVEPGQLYGLREPGESVVYEDTRGPAESLARIAEDLDP